MQDISNHDSSSAEGAHYKCIWWFEPLHVDADSEAYASEFVENLYLLNTFLFTIVVVGWSRTNNMDSVITVTCMQRVNKNKCHHWVLTQQMLKI